MKRCRLKRSNFQIRNKMNKENKTSDKHENGNDFIADVSGSALLSKARQMRLEQQLKIDSYTEHYNDYEIGALNGIDRIVKLIERHYR